MIPMKAKGGKGATRTKAVAEVIRREMWRDMQRTYAPLPKTAGFWVEEFRRWNGVKSKARQVRENARVVERFVAAEGIVRVHEIDMAQVVAYLDGLKRTGVKDRTVQQHRNALHLFCRFLMLRQELHLNPVAPVAVASPAKEAPRFLTARAQDILLRRVATKCPDILLAVQVALWAGPRLSSLRAMKWSGVGEDLLTVPLTKTRSYALVPFAKMDPRLREAVARGGRGMMFPEHGATWWVRRLKEATGLMPQFGQVRGPGAQWHLLRATWAVERARAGATLWELMAWGGWTSPQTVMRYVNLAQASGGRRDRL